MRVAIMVRPLALVLVTVLLSGCSSIPLLTMWKLHSFGPQEVKALDPATIRVAIKLPTKLEFEPEKTTLDIELKPKDMQVQPLHERANLVLLSKGAEISAGVPAAEPGYIWYLLKLSLGGISSFKDFQHRLTPDIKQRYKSITLNVNWSTPNFDAFRSTAYLLTVWLRLQKNKGYFPLFENARVMAKVVKPK